MKKFISLLFVLGFILYLKPGLKFENNQNCMTIKFVPSEGVIASVGQAGQDYKSGGGGWKAVLYSC